LVTKQSGGSLRKITVLAILLFIIIPFGFGQTIGAKYLIITADAFYNDILPLAQWKHKKGVRTKIVTLSEIGSTQTQIHDYIYNAYSNWSIRPEYVLLVGAPNYIPYPIISNVYTDNYYTNMSGDLHNEILSGRLTVHSRTECQTVVNKILMYERTPDTTNTAWFRKGCLIANVDTIPPGYDDSIYFSDVRYYAARMVNEGYTRVDTLSDYYGDDYNDVYSAVNDGRMFLLYRGSGTNNWYSPFDCNPDVLTNGKKMPIVLSMTCNTIGRSSTPAAAEKWFLTGSPTSPRGGVGYFATTTSISNGAYLRSATAQGFADGVFTLGKRTFGQCCEEGRSRVYQMYSSATEYYGFNTIGDPEMNIWTGVPRPLTVTHDTIFYIGSDTINVKVQCAGAPVESALVCVMFDTLIYNTGYTDAAGNISWPLYIPYPGMIQLTVTGRNYYPYERDIEAIGSNDYLSCGHEDIEDSLGNNNDQVDAGESIILWATVKNLGTTPAPGVAARLRTSDTLVFISDSTAYYGEIAGTDSARGLSPFVFTLSSRAPTHKIPFTVLMRDNLGNSWLGSFSISAYGTGGGGNGTGPDQYGYYIYDDTDSSSGNAPVYNWFEIAPPAGGPGQIIPQITNADGDTVTLPLPFTFKYYSISYNSIGCCSNGFLELGHSTTYTRNNTNIPQVGGPRRLLAGFWDNLNVGNLHMGHGDIYQYYDAANHRWIIEFYQAALYDNPDAWETFQIILRDPQHYPTPTGDGEALFMYKIVEDATSNSVGIEDETEQRGLQYLYDNGYDPNAAPLVSGRTLLITTKPPVNNHSPWLYLLNYAVNDSAGGNNNGVVDPGETVAITVNLKNGGDTLAAGVNGILKMNDMDAILVDSVSDFGDMPMGATSGNDADPYVIQVSPAPADSTIGLLLKLTANNGAYLNQDYFTLYISIQSGVQESSSKDRLTGRSLKVFPNPARGQVNIRYMIHDAGCMNNKVSFKIYDITGRMVKNLSINLGSCIMNRVSVLTWDGTDQSGRTVSAGVYFIKLETGKDVMIEKLILLK
jgi:hypothetical protein